MNSLSPTLTALLGNPLIWRGTKPAVVQQAVHRPTGFEELDAVLPMRGWPATGLVEILSAAPGLGELSLVLPMLAGLSAQQKPIVMVAPPYRPYAPTWHCAGIRLGQLYLAETHTDQGLWAMEKALRSGCCGAVLGWPAQADDRSLRRLQVAAEGGQTLGFIFRALGAARAPSPAPLRLSLEAKPQGSVLQILKCRGIHPPSGSILLRPTAH